MPTTIFQACGSQGEKGKLVGTGKDKCYLPCHHLPYSQQMFKNDTTESHTTNLSGTRLQERLGLCRDQGQVSTQGPSQLLDPMAVCSYHYVKGTLTALFIQLEKRNWITAFQRSSVPSGLCSNHLSEGS